MAKVSRAWVLLGAGGLAIATLRCGLMPSLDELSGGERPSDAAPDVKSDVTSPDAGDAGRWCDSVVPAPMFCDDFDDQGPFIRWDGQSTSSGGFVMRDGTTSRSAPSSLLVVTPPAADHGSALLYHATKTSRGKVRFAYDIKVDARDTKTRYAEANYIRFEGALHFSIYLRLHQELNLPSVMTSEAYPDGSVVAHDVPLGAGSNFDAWTRVVVTVDLVSSPRTMKVTLDGVEVGSQALEPGLYGPGPVTVQAGVSYTGAPMESDWRVRYDNVTIDWE